MSTEQPSNAPDAIPTDARDDRSAAAVLTGSAHAPGGAPLGGTTTNSPVDVATADAPGLAGAPASGAQRERRDALRDAATAAPEPHPASR